jgi:hypothetical protein
MSITAKHLKMLEDEIMNLRVSLEQFRAPQRDGLLKPTKDRTKLLNLFGAWDGEIETVLQEFYTRRERRGRLE